MWLWCRPAAIAPMQPLARELPYAIGLALKSKKKKRRRRYGTYEITNVWTLIQMKQKNLFTKQKKRLKDFETKLVVTKGEGIN